MWGAKIIGQHNSEQEPSFKLETAMEFVPKFSEEEPERFFTFWKKTAALHNWPVDKWILLAQSSFEGRAQEVFTSHKVFTYHKVLSHFFWTKKVTLAP